jgi:CPA2 family monovalent cation:H+ antiporter-2
MKVSDQVSDFVDAKLPKPLQTFTALYGSWVERLKAGSQTETFWKKVRRMAGFLMLDTLILIAVVITTAATLRHWMPQFKEMLPLPPDVLRASLWGVGILFSIPFLGGILRETRALGVLLAEAAIPSVPEGKLDLGLAPRRVLTLALQMAILFAVGFPLLAATQPFLPFGYSPGLMVAFLVVLGAIFWKRAVNLQGHVQAGAELLAQVISRAGQAPGKHHEPESVRMEPNQVPEQVVQMVPGIGAPTSVSIGRDCGCVGKTLGELNLRSLTGASIIAVTRGEERHLMPSGRESLQVGDIVVLVGTHEAVAQAKDLLQK